MGAIASSVGFWGWAGPGPFAFRFNPVGLRQKGLGSERRKVVEGSEETRTCFLPAPFSQTWQNRKRLSLLFRLVGISCPQAMAVRGAKNCVAGWRRREASVLGSPFGEATAAPTAGLERSPGLL